MKFNSNDKTSKQPKTAEPTIEEINEAMNEIDELFESISESIDDDLELDDFDISSSLDEMTDSKEYKMIKCKGCKALCEPADLNNSGICEDCSETVNEELSIDDLEFESIGESKDMEGDDEESDDSEEDDEYEIDEEDEDEEEELDDDEDDALLDDEYDEEDMLDGDDLIEQVIAEDEIMESILLDEQVEELTEDVDLTSINDEIDEILAESEESDIEDINDLCIQESNKLEELLKNIDVLDEQAIEDTNSLNTIIAENVSSLPEEKYTESSNDALVSEVVKRRQARADKNNLSIDQSLNGHNK